MIFFSNDFLSFTLWPLPCTHLLQCEIISFMVHLCFLAFIYPGILCQLSAPVHSICCRQHLVWRRKTNWPTLVVIVVKLSGRSWSCYLENRSNKHTHTHTHRRSNTTPVPTHTRLPLIRVAGLFLRRRSSHPKLNWNQIIVFSMKMFSLNL